MTKLAQDVTMWSGDHKNLTYTITDTTGASVNLTGACATWTLATGPTGGSLARLTADSGSGITVSGCTLTVALSPVHTASLAGQYYTEVQVTDTGGNVSTVAVGTITINFDVAV